MKKIERFSKYMIYKGLSDNKVATDTGLANGLLGKARTGDRDLSAKSLDKILNFYTDINPAWLLSGEGEMLRSPQPVSSTSGVKIGDVTASINGCAAAEGSPSELQALRKENEALRRERDDALRERDRLAGANTALTEVIRQLTGKN